MQYQLITQQADFEHYLASLADVPLAIDTEFVRTRTYYPQLGLFQIYDGEHLALLDPLTLDLSALWQRLGREGQIAILHASGEDLELSSIRQATCPIRCTIPSWLPPSSVTASRSALARW